MADEDVLQNKKSFYAYIFETINLHRSGKIDDGTVNARALMIGRVQKQVDIEMKYATLTKTVPNIPLLND